MPKTNTSNTKSNKIRTTIAASSSPIAMILAIAVYLAERNNTAAVQSISQKLGSGDLGPALELAIAAVQRMTFGDTENPIDTDGKSLYVGMHPFRENTFGIYRSELRGQHVTNATRASEVAERKKLRDAERAAAKASKAAKAEQRAAKALEKAQKAQARAETIAKKYNLKLDDVKVEAHTSAEAASDLASVRSTSSQPEPAATA
jgi:hypothetical protein